MEENIAVRSDETTASASEASPAAEFDALMREKEFQSEFDRRVTRALETARGKWARETERRVEQARAEAERLARMTGEERMAHDFAQREAQLHAREQEIERRELQADAARMIRERGLPAELIGVMGRFSAEGMEESIDAMGAAFNCAVQAGVEERMRGQAPLAVRHADPADESDADYYRANYVPRKR